MLYIFIIVIGMILVAGLNIAFGGFSLPWHYIVIATILFTLLSIIVDGIVAFVIRLLPS